MKSARSRRKEGIIVVFMLASLATLMLVGTMVLYHAVYAYRAAQQYQRTLEQTYALEGLINYALVIIQSQIPQKTVESSYIPWLTADEGRLTIVPHENHYTITAEVQCSGSLLSKSLYF